MVELSVANFLSTSVSRTRITMTRSAQPVPKVEITGGSRVVTSQRSITSLRVRVRASSCGTGRVQQTTVTWRATAVATDASGLALPSLPTDSELAALTRTNGFLLRMPAGMLRAGFTYTFEASVGQQSANGPVLGSSVASVDVVVQPIGLLATISNNRQRIVQSNEIKLSALSSADLDLSGSPLGFEWNCRNTSGLATSSNPEEVFESISSDCINSNTGLPLDLTSTAALPIVSLPPGLLGDLAGTTGRGPVLQLPAGALAAG